MYGASLWRWGSLFNLTILSGVEVFGLRLGWFQKGCDSKAIP
jgi:hypothetical protein